MKQLIFILLYFITPLSFCQNSLSDLLSKHNTKNIAYMSVQELAMPKTTALILDAREVNEFNTSHIKNAIYVGYNHFNIKTIKDLFPNKSSLIVVYCSLGIRSENIAYKLKKAGYNSVFNLYGGIFEWKNNNFSVVDRENNETEKVHVFSKEWSKWLTKGEKIY